MTAIGYFVLPQVTINGEDVPKYLYEADASSLTGVSLRDEVEKFYGSEYMEYNSTQYMAVRVFIDDVTYPDAMSTLESQSDAYRIFPTDVRDALNNLGVFPVNISARHWALLLDKFNTQPLEST